MTFHFEDPKSTWVKHARKERDNNKLWKPEELSPLSAEDMIKYAEDELKAPCPLLPTGNMVLLKLISQTHDDFSHLAIPDHIIKDNTRYNTRVGKVLAWGPGAYIEKSIFFAGPQAFIGSYVLFNKYENQNFSYTYEDETIELGLVADHKINGIVLQPKALDVAKMIGY